MTPFVFLIAALATWCLTSLLVYEDGPFDLFVRLRDAVGVRYDEHSQPYGATMVARMLTCPKCTSVWIGLIVAALLYLNAAALWMFVPFALSAGSRLLFTLVRRLEL